MSFGDPSQQELREMNGLPPDVSEEEVQLRAPAYAQIHSFTSASANKVATPVPVAGSEPFTANDVDMMRQAIWTQGRFFLGIDVTTPERATRVARDLMWLLDVMLYQKPVPKQNGPLSPLPGWPWSSGIPQVAVEGFTVPEQTVGGEVTGQAGNTR